MTEDFIWIGSNREHYVFGREAFQKQVERVYAVAPNVVITNENYHIVSSVPGLCVVLGSYLAFTDPSSQQVLSQEQRFTFIWEQQDDGTWKINHFHISNPLMLLDDDEPFPVKAGKETFDYMATLMRRREKKSTAEIRDVDGTIHWISPSEIMYVTAQKQRSVIHCLEKDIVVYKGLSEVISQFRDDLVRVHRSCAVNPQHVDIQRGKVLVLSNGTEVEVSSRRLGEVKSAFKTHR